MTGIIRIIYSIIFFSITGVLFHIPGFGCQFPEEYLFENIYLNNKNSFGIVEDIQQDTLGFIWIGAKDGLFRYDGIQFVSFFYNRSDTTSLSSNVIRDIFIDSRGIMWIGTENGLNRYIPETDNFQRYYNEQDNPHSLAGNNVRKITEDSKGNLWFATLGGGVCRFDVGKSEFVKIDQLVDKGNSEFPSHVRTIFIDSRNTLWLGTVDKGVLYFSLDTLKLHRLLSGKADGKHVNGMDIRAIVEDTDGKLWIGTNGKGISCFDRSNKTFTYFNTQAKQNQQISSDVIWNLYIDSKNNLWVCTDGGGLLRFNKWEKAFIVYKTSVADPNNLSSDVVRVFFEDNAGSYWIGNFNAPVNYCNINRKKFHLLRNFDPISKNRDQNKITSILLNSENIMWICTDGAGLYSYDTENMTVKNYSSKPGNPETIQNNKPLCIADDSRGNLWLGLYEGGLSCFRIKENKFVNYYFDGTENTPKSTQIWDILIYGNILWLAGDQGIENYNLITGKFNHNPFPDFSENIYSAWCLMHDSKNRLWIGTLNGLFVYDQQKGSVYHMVSETRNLRSLSENWVFNIFEDPENRIWVGTNGGGLNLWKGGNEFECFSVNNGLSGNVINGILSDNAGNLWISTNGGITRFNPDSLCFKNFDSQDGLQENRFSLNSCFSDQAGMLYFGGINGLSYFAPEEISINKFIPPVVITELELFENPALKKDAKTQYMSNILYKDEIHLYPGQQIFTIKFAALNYSYPHRNQYKYKLEGFDDKWNEVGNQHWATYTSLHPGRYTFKVNGSNDDRVWNNVGRELCIIVHPSFYQTKGFRIMILLSVILILLLGYRLRVRRIQKLNARLARLVSERTHELEVSNREIVAKNLELEDNRSRLEELVKERTQDLEVAKERAEDSDRLKTAFIENLSYQVRTPMNAIIGFINLLAENIDDKLSRNYYMKIINESGREMLQLIGDIIDFSRIQTGQLQPEFSECHIDKLIRELVSSVREHASRLNPSISIMAEVPDNGLILYTDGEKLRQIFSKLIDNSLKYTEKGYIKIGVKEQEPENVTFFVEDSGIGIEKKYIDKIFDRFFTLERKEESEKFRGEGLGLAFAKLLTELLGGSIWAESIKTEGSTFYFRLPVMQVIPKSKQAKEPGRMKYYWPGKTLLVAEDEESNFLLIEAILKDAGVTLVHVVDGVELLEKIDTGITIDLILLDIKMPRMSGTQAIKIIRESYPDVPVIVQTAYDKTDHRKQCKELGCNEFMVKPLGKKEVLDILSKYLG